MPQINDRILDALLKEITLSKPLSKKLLEESYAKIEAEKKAGRQVSFKKIMREVASRHTHELKDAEDYRKANSLVSRYFLACRKISKERKRLEQLPNQVQVVAQRKPDEQLELFENGEIKFLSREKFDEILIQDHCFSKYYRRP